MLCLQECQYSNKNQSLETLEIDNYQIFHKISTIGKNGGIVVYVHNSTTAEEISFFENKSKIWEGLTLKISHEKLKKPITLHTVYRPPREKSGHGEVKHARENHEKFIEEFKPYLQTIKKEQKDTILVGDLNYNLMESSTNSMVQEYFDSMITNELQPQITVPTKINRQSCNLYDHIFTKFRSSLNIDSCVHVTKISDHLPVFISLSTYNTKKSPKKYREVKVNTDENMQKVIDKLTDLMQETKFEHDLTTDLNINQQKLDDIIQNSLKEIPTKKVKITKYNTKHSPWITQGLLNSIKKRDTLYKQLVKTKATSPSYTTKQAKLKDHKTLLNKLLRKTKREHYTTQLKKFSSDCKNTWKLLNQVAGRKATKKELPAYFKQIVEGPKEQDKQNDPLEITHLRHDYC